MSYLCWSSDLDTGIAEIDTQHRRIVDYINRLTSSQGNGDLQAVDRVLDELIGYTLLYFGHKEKLQVQTNNAFYASHEKLTRHIHEFKLRCGSKKNAGPAGHARYNQRQLAARHAEQVPQPYLNRPSSNTLIKTTRNLVESTSKSKPIEK